MRHFAYATDLSGRSRQLATGLEKRDRCRKALCGFLSRHFSPLVTIQKMADRLEGTRGVLPGTARVCLD